MGMPQITKKDYQTIAEALGYIEVNMVGKKIAKRIKKARQKIQEIVMYQSQIRNNPKAGG